ncbi:MAG: gliding motility-associated C-terminal domain-containing protein [Flavobacteriales bacterium]|nr:gliding motility-associated C-terminal domain-containing protein [Flavobacteriales bacterium]
MTTRLTTIFITLLLFGALPVTAQLEVDNTTTPEEALEILLGDGIDVFNVTFSGDPEQIGSFNSENANIGMPEGVVLGSGDVTLGTGVGFDPMTFEQIVGEGGNQSGSSGLGGGNFGVGDPDLTTLSTFDTNDAAVLEFDFTPTGDSISFFYVFGSEEYNDFVCGTVNDAFCFFLSGPGINGPFTNNAINMATVPDTDIPVTINTVNNGVSGQFDDLNCEAVSPDWDQNTEYFIDNSTETDDVTVVEYDGLTVVLRAQAQVICGETYHIKIAIADGGDTSFDSGVFLQKDSFTSEGVNLFANIESALNDSTVYEGCGLAEIVFQRNAGIAEAVDINVYYSGSAQEGVDYADLPDILTLEAGEETGSLILDTFADGITEGLETVTFEVDVQACNSDSATFTIYIDDTPLEMETSVTTPYCPGDDVTLNAMVTGGLPPYTMSWSNGFDGFQQVVNPLVPESYTVTVEDACGNTVTQTILAPVPEPDPLTITFNENYTSDCPEDFTIVANVTGGIGQHTYLWIEDGATISNTTFVTRFFEASTTLSLTVSDECGAETTEEVNISIGETNPLILVMDNDTTICRDDLINIAGEATGGTLPYSYQWAHGPSGNSTGVSPFNNRTYELTVTDGCGIETSNNIDIGVSWVEANFDIQWQGGDEYLFTPDNTEATEYLWNFGNGAESTEVAPLYTYPSLDEFYDVTLLITNDLGCTDQTYRTISPPLEVYVPSAFTPDYDGINDVFTYSVNGVDEFEMYIFNRWGEVVWSTTTIGEFWNGNVDGGEHFAQDNTYTWLIKVRAKNIFSEEFFGTVTILR